MIVCKRKMLGIDSNLNDRKFVFYIIVLYFFCMDIIEYRIKNKF